MNATYAILGHSRGRFRLRPETYKQGLPPSIINQHNNEEKGKMACCEGQNLVGIQSVRL